MLIEIADMAIEIREYIASYLDVENKLEKIWNKFIWNLFYKKKTFKKIFNMINRMDSMYEESLSSELLIEFIEFVLYYREYESQDAWEYRQHNFTIKREYHEEDTLYTMYKMTTNSFKISKSEYYVSISVPGTTMRPHTSIMCVYRNKDDIHMSNPFSYTAYSDNNMMIDSNNSSTTIMIDAEKLLMDIIVTYAKLLIEDIIFIRTPLPRREDDDNE